MTDDERDDRIDTLTDAVADTNRAVRELVGVVAGVSRDVASLTTVVRLHLFHDHGYGDDPDAG